MPKDTSTATATEQNNRKIVLGPAMLCLSYLILASALCWPLVKNISTSILLGTESCATVPLFNLWTLQWNQIQIAERFANYWNAPIFYPYPNSFALSDPQPLSGVIFSLLNFATAHTVRSYNLLSILYLTLNGAAAFYFLRTLKIPVVAAGLTAVLAIAFPFVSNELGVIQLTAVFPIFYALAFLVRTSQNPRLLNALFLGFWTGASYLFSSYYGLYLSLFLLLSSFFFFGYRLLQPKVLLKLLTAALLAAAITLPVVGTQFSISKGFSRSKKMLKNTSAEMIDYRKLDKRSLGSSGTPWLVERGGSPQKLYPGTALLLLSLVAIFRRRKKSDCAASNGDGQTPYYGYFVTATLIALLLSFGVKLNIGYWLPYETLREYVPGFRLMRSSFRFAMFVQVFLVALAGIGCSQLWKWRAPLGQILAFAIVLGGVLETSAIPKRLYKPSSVLQNEKWVAALQDLPQAPVIHLPLPRSGKTCEFKTTSVAMLQSLQYDKPLLNGYSGLFPKEYRRLKKSLQHFPSLKAIQFLQKVNARYLVLDTAFYEKLSSTKINTLSGQTRMVYRDTDKVIFELVS